MAAPFLSIEVDAVSLRALYAKLDLELWREALAKALTDGIHQAEAEVKALTPVLTGNLRRSIVPDLSSIDRDRAPYAKLWTNVVYAWPVEDRVGMFADGATALEAKLPGILDSVAREVESRWAA